MIAKNFNIRVLQKGFTLVELITVIVILGIMSAYATMKGTSPSPANLTLPSQAQKLASDIRHMQTLAYTLGRSMRLIITAGTNGTYSISCVTSSCSQSFSVTLQKNVVLNCTDITAKACTNTTFDFNSLGQPSGSVSLTLMSGSNTKTVAIAALTGLVTVSP